VAVDDLVPGSHPINRVGHQGLFYEHLDGGDGLQPNSVGLYYNRNRWYSPALGRFISRDPNETALPIIRAVLMKACTPRPRSAPFAPEWHYAEGMSLYQYVRSNPISYHDPLGTETQASQLVTVSIMAAVAGMVLGEMAEDLRVGEALVYGVTGIGNEGYKLFVDGIDAFQTGMYRAAEELIVLGATFMAMSQAQAVQEARDLNDAYIEHTGKIQTGGPNDPGRNHHEREIRG